MAVTAPDTEQDHPGPGTGSGPGSATDSGPDFGPDFARVRAAGRVVKAFVVDYEPARYTGEDSLTLLKFFTELERIAGAAKTLAAAQVASSNLHARTGERSAADFIAHQTGESVGEVRDLVGLGQALAGQPRLDDALRNGKIPRRRAKRTSDAARVNPAREDDLVRGAQNDTEAENQERCQRAKAEGRSRQDAARHRRKLHENRSCYESMDDDGAFCLHAKLTPEIGAEVKASLDAQADRQFKQACSEGRSEPSTAYRADALAALITGRNLLGPEATRADQANQANQAAGTTAGTTDPSNPGTTDSSTPGTPGTPTAHPTVADPPVRARDPKATLNVVIDLDTLRQGSVAPGGRCEIPGVGPVPVAWAQDLLGECLLHVLVTSATDIHAVWSTSRHLRRDVRAALLLRDPRCVVPGCDAKVGLEHDHWAKDFAQGGLTALDNLARICKRHHRQRTHEGYELRKGTKGWEWIPPATPKVRKRPKRRRKPTVTADPTPTAPPRPTTPPHGTSPPLFDLEE